MKSTSRRAEASDDSAVSVAISAGSTLLRARIERLARQAGACVVDPDAKFQVLLLAIDSLAQIPARLKRLVCLFHLRHAFV